MSGVYTAAPCTIPQPLSAVSLSAFIVLRQLGFRDVQYEESEGMIRGNSPSNLLAMRVWALDAQHTSVQVSSSIPAQARQDFGANRRLADRIGEEIAEAAAQFASGRLDPVTALDSVRLLDATPPP